MNLIGYDSDHAFDNHAKLARSANNISRVNRGINATKKPHTGGKAKRSGGFCCYCEVELTRLSFSWDHIHPKSKGGRVKKPCCRKCNAEKRDMTLVEYMQYISKKAYESSKDDLDIKKLAYKSYQRKIANIEKILNEQT